MRRLRTASGAAAAAMAASVLLATPVHATAYDPALAYVALHASATTTAAACTRGYGSTLTRDDGAVTAFRYDAVHHIASTTVAPDPLLTSTITGGSRRYAKLNRTAEVRGALKLAGVPNATWTWSAVPSTRPASLASSACAAVMLGQLRAPGTPDPSRGYVLSAADRAVSASGTLYTVTVNWEGEGADEIWTIGLDTAGRVISTTWDGLDATRYTYGSPALSLPAATSSIYLTTLSRAIDARYLLGTTLYYTSQSVTLAGSLARSAHRALSVAYLRTAATRLKAAAASRPIPVVYTAITGGIRWSAYNPFTRRTVAYRATVVSGRALVVRLS